HESLNEREEHDPARGPGRRAGSRGRYDDPVRDPPLDEIALDHRTQRGAEQRQPSQRERGEVKNDGAEREGHGTGPGRDQASGCHGSRGAAVAWAPTVSVETPTSRSRIVGTRRCTSTCTSPVFALACPRRPG